MSCFLGIQPRWITKKPSTFTGAHRTSVWSDVTMYPESSVEGWRGCDGRDGAEDPSGARCSISRAVMYCWLYSMHFHTHHVPPAGPIYMFIWTKSKTTSQRLKMILNNAAFKNWNYFVLGPLFSLKIASLPIFPQDFWHVKMKDFSVNVTVFTVPPLLAAGVQSRPWTCLTSHIILQRQ